MPHTPSPRSKTSSATKPYSLRLLGCMPTSFGGKRSFFTKPIVLNLSVACLVSIHSFFSELLSSSNCSMIGVSRYYDKKPVIKDISLSFFHGAKIGVLGLNGSGKSTLLRIMAGVDQEYNGRITMTPGFTIGYLEQEPLAGETKTVWEVVKQGAREPVDLLAEFSGE